MEEIERRCPLCCRMTTGREGRLVALLGQLTFVWINFLRRSGQRSRVRKLQYISDLQKTVDALQTMGAELAAKVASLFQQRVALSLENKSMRQQIAILRHEKIIKDGEHQYLKNEAERLKMTSGRHRRSKSISSPFLEAGLRENIHSGTSWQSLDFRKLSLGEGSVSFNHGLGH